MQEQKEYLSENAQSILTVLSSAVILLAFGSGYNMLAIIALMSMVVLKYHVVVCYGRKLDKFYLYMFAFAAFMMIVLEILNRM